jgi:superfamily II DNA or RNA helicase
MHADFENTFADIGGARYRLVELLQDPEGKSSYVICADVTNPSQRRCMPAKRWLAASVSASVATRPGTSAIVTSKSTDTEKIALFRSLFQGRSDAYAKSYLSKKRQRLEYLPACANEWDRPVCKKPAIRCSACTNRTLKPLDDETLKAHFRGQRDDGADVVGIYPLLEDDTTNLLVADFDDDGWREEALAYLHVCRDMEIPAYLERSRSGNGGHVWVFFKDPIPAAIARSIGLRAISLAMERYLAMPFTSYDRLFPSQDTMPSGGFGNLIALPLQGSAVRQGNSVFVNDDLEPYPDQWRLLSSVRRLPACEAKRIAPTKAEDALGGLLSKPPKERPWERRQPLPVNLFAETAMVQATFANLLYVSTDGMGAPEVNAIRRLAAFANPDFRRAAVMHQSLYGIPRVIYAGEDGDGYVGLPRGCKDTLLGLLETVDTPYELDDKRERGRTIDVSFTGTLRPEQQQAVDALLAHDDGILSAATGFGKTVVGASLIARRQVSTLVLVPTTALLEQWRKRLLGFLDIHDELPGLRTKTGRKSRKTRSVVGQIGGGKNLPSGIIDVAIPSSLFEKGDVQGEKRVKDLIRGYGMVICDECHHVPSTSYEQVVRHACATFVYGLTATPMRKDQLDPLMFMQCGPLRHHFDGKDQAALQSFQRLLVPRFTRHRLPDGEEHRAFATLLDHVCGDADRNVLIIDDATRLYEEGRTPLVLTRRVKHARALHEQLRERGVNSILLVGSDKSKIKAEKLEALRSLPPDARFAVVATGSYVGEGFDDDRLDALLLAAPYAWKGLVVQYAGRLHRERVGKDDVLIYDYVDTHVPMFDDMYRKRLKEYALLGYQVQVLEEGAPSAFFSGADYRERFSIDLTAAERSVFIRASSVNPKGIGLISETLAAATSRGVVVTISAERPEAGSRYLKTYEESVTLLRQYGCAVEQGEARQPDLAIIDGKIIWYGEIDFCSFNRKTAQSLRFESVSVAHDLLA